MSVPELDMFGLAQDQPEPPAGADLFPNATDVSADQIAAESDAEATSQPPTEETAPEEALGAQEEAPSEPETPEPEPRRYGPDGRFTSPEDLEQGYSHLLALDGRRSNELGELRSQVVQLQDLLRSASAALQERQAPQAPPALDPEYLRQAAERGQDPESLQAAAQIAAQVAAAQSRALSDQMLAQQLQAQEQREIEAQRSAASAALQTFVGQHPEVASDVNLEAQIERTFTELGFTSYDPVEWTDLLNITHEAVTNPSLGNVLRAMPELAATDYGLVLARQMAAGAPPVNGSPGTTTDAARQAALAGAQVERGGGGGAPQTGPGGPTPANDSWEAVKQLTRDERQQSASTVFGV